MALPVESSKLWYNLAKDFETEQARGGICYWLKTKHGIDVYDDTQNEQQEHRIWFQKRKPPGVTGMYWFRDNVDRARFCREIAEELELQGL